MTPQEGTRLRETIKSLIPQIVKYRDANLSEAETRADLIDRMLEVLGWDIHNHEEVVHESKAEPGYNPVDYTLMVLGKAKLVIEAKGLGKPLEAPKWLQETLGNATMAGAEWGILTDGDEYRIYNITVAVDGKEKLLRTIRLSDEEDDAAADTLSLLLHSEFTEGKPRIESLWTDRCVLNALQAMLNPTDQEHPGLVNLIHKKSNLKPKEVAEALTRLKIQIQFDSPPTCPPVTLPVVGTPLGMPLLDAAAKVLADAGRPMHCQEILDAMKAQGLCIPGGKSPVDNIAGSMWGDMHTKGAASRFKKAGYGLFALNIAAGGTPQ